MDIAKYHTYLCVIFKKLVTFIYLREHGSECTDCSCIKVILKTVLNFLFLVFEIHQQQILIFNKTVKLRVVSFHFLEKRQIGLFSNGRQERKEASRAEVLLALGLAKSFGHQRPAGRGQRRDLRLERVSF